MFDFRFQSTKNFFMLDFSYEIHDNFILLLRLERKPQFLKLEK